MRNIPERFLWAAELLNIKPRQTILEIGCGAGLLAEQINNRLSDGAFTAIDKSASMVEKARKRNAEFVKAGWASFLVADFTEINFPGSHFDSIVAFNVNFFWREAQAELKKIRYALKQSGKLLVCYQAPYDITLDAAEPIRQNLERNSFEILHMHIKKFQPASAICVIATPRS